MYPAVELTSSEAAGDGAEARIRASVIVPARNAAETIERVLAALEQQTSAGRYDVIVVDDGSDDRTGEIADAFDGDLDVRVLWQRPSGAAAARNAGAAASRADALVFTDSDCYATAHWLEEGLSGLLDADLVQGCVTPDPQAELGPWDRTLWVERETGLFETANLFVRREVFDLVGGFESWIDPSAGSPMGEDVWFGWRAKRAGATSAYRPEALVHHAVFPRGPLGFLGERRRLAYFPAMAAKMPELRRQFFTARLFLSRRSAAFDAALAGASIAALARSPWPLVVAAPYARILVGVAWPYRRRAPVVGAIGLLGDAISLVSLAMGSVRARTLVL